MNLAEVEALQGRKVRAWEHCKRALNLYRELDERLGEATCVSYFGVLHHSEGNAVATQEHYEQALALYREVGDGLGEANCLQGLAILRLLRGEAEEARRYCAEATHRFQELGMEEEARCNEFLKS